MTNFCFWPCWGKRKKTTELDLPSSLKQPGNQTKYEHENGLGILGKNSREKSSLRGERTWEASRTPQLTAQTGHTTEKDALTEPGSHATETGRRNSEFGEAKAATVCRQNKRKRRELERERDRESMHSMSVQADRTGRSANMWGLGRNSNGK